MKKVLSFLILTFVSSALAYAVGFQDNGASKMTVINALKMGNNSYVTVEGNIIKQISDDKYLFKDSTGSMTVEIDTDKWNGMTVKPQDKLELSGEIEKKMTSVILDVDTVKNVK